MIQVQVAFHGLDHSPALVTNIEEHAARLTRFSSRPLHCRVSIEGPPHHRLDGYRVRLHVTSPVEDVIVADGPAEAEPYQAVAHAFATAQRILVEKRTRRGHRRQSIRHH